MNALDPILKVVFFIPLHLFGWISSFRQPWVLLFLIIPAALLVWVWRRRGQQIVLPLDHSSAARGRVWGVILDVAESLPALVLALAILLLAGPQRYAEPEAKRKLTNIELCLDISGSMTAEFGEGSRYDTAMKSVEEFLGYRKGDAVGLTFFGNSVLHWCPLTSDTSAVKCAPPFMRPENVPRWFNGTEIGKALRSCKQVLVERQEGDRMIVLLTDGESYDLFNNAEAIAKELKEANITVFAIIIGMDRIQDEIITITHTTGGEAFEAGDPDALRHVFKRIDQMKQAPMEKKLADALDDYRPYCVLALGLLGFCTVTAFGFRYTPW
jgi:Ca-activated chloride channel family protein